MKKKKEKIKVTYIYEPVGSEEENQKAVDEGFNTLFDIVYKNYWLPQKMKELKEDEERQNKC